MTTLERIMQFHGEMRDLTITFAGVTTAAYDRVVEKVELYTEEEKSALLVWLEDIRRGLYKELRRVYMMPPNPAQTWAMYKLHETEGLQEQLLMDRAAHALRKAWHSPYKPSRIIRRGKKADATEHDRPAEGDSGIGVRSQGDGSDEGNR